MAHKHTCWYCDAVIAEGDFDCEFDRDHDFEICERCSTNVDNDAKEGK